MIGPLTLLIIVLIVILVFGGWRYNAGLGGGPALNILVIVAVVLFLFWLVGAIH